MDTKEVNIALLYIYISILEIGRKIERIAVIFLWIYILAWARGHETLNGSGKKCVSN